MNKKYILVTILVLLVGGFGLFHTAGAVSPNFQNELLITGLDEPTGTNYSLKFSGNGSGDIDRVKILLDGPARPADIGAGNFTIEFWMKVNSSDDVSSGRTCATGRDAWISGGIMLDNDIFSDGDFGDYGLALFAGKVGFGVSKGTAGATVCGTRSVVDGAWHHVALTRNSSTGSLTVFVDGTQDGQINGPTGDLSYRDGRSTQYPNSDPYLVIGAEKHDAGSTGAYPAYRGFMDELRLSNSIRYASSFTRPTQPFVTDGSTAALYHFDEASGSSALDSSGASGGPSNGIVKVGGSPSGPLWVTDTPFSSTPPPPDTTPPTVSISAPAGGATVSGTTIITANAFDNVAVAGVQFQIDSVNFGIEDTIAPYTTSWDTNTASNAGHTITAIARDTSNNTNQTSIPVTVDNTTPPIPAGLVAGYGFNEGSGTVTSEAYGINNQGSLVNGPLWIAGRFGQAIDFDGSNDRVLVSSPQNLPSANFTYSFWINLDTVNDETIVMIPNITGGNEIYLVSESGRFGAYVDGTRRVRTNTGTVLASTWTHVAVTRLGGEIRIFLNGLQNGPTGNYAGVLNFGTCALYVGVDVDSGCSSGFGNYTNGRVDELRIYNRALSQTEIQTDMNTAVGVPPAPDTTAPSVSIIAPASGATVSGTTIITANASDNVAVAGVQFQIDSVNFGIEDTIAPYTTSWDTNTASNAGHTITAIARDTSNNTNQTSIPVTVDNTTPPSGLLVTYGMNEGSGTNLSDSSGNSNTASIFGASWSSGRYGNGLSLDGVDDRATASAITLPATFTLEAWVNNPSNQFYETIMTIGSNRDLYIDGGTLGFYTNVTESRFGIIPTGSWQHVTITYDGTNLRAYLNGNQLGNPTPYSLTAEAAALQLGAWISGSSSADFFSGLIDEVRVYNRALSQTEIQTDMNTPLP